MKFENPQEQKDLSPEEIIGRSTNLIELFANIHKIGSLVGSDGVTLHHAEYLKEKVEEVRIAAHHAKEAGRDWLTDAKTIEALVAITRTAGLRDKVMEFLNRGFENPQEQKDLSPKEIIGRSTDLTDLCINLRKVGSLVGSDGVTLYNAEYLERKVDEVRIAAAHAKRAGRDCLTDAKTREALVAITRTAGLRDKVIELITRHM